MFTDSANSDELYSEYLSDLPELERKSERLDNSIATERLLRKFGKQERAVFAWEFRVGYNLYGTVFHYKRSAAKDRGFTERKWTLEFTTHVGFVRTERGTDAILFYSGAKKGIRLRPHFLKRYKERLSAAGDWKTRMALNSCRDLKSLAMLFVKRNPDIVWIETSTVFGNKTHIFSPVNDGVALMQWDSKKKLLKANTFVTLDMLSKEQLKMVVYATTYMSMTPDERSATELPLFAGCPDLLDKTED